MEEYTELCKISHEYIVLMNRFKRLDCMGLLKELSPAEFMCLKALAARNYQNSQDVTVTELANIMLISGPAISKTLRNLEEKGMVTRTVNTRNRRTTYVKLTEKGKEAYVREDQVMSGFGGRIMERYGKENAKQLLEQMQTLYDVLKEELESIKMEGKHVIED